MTIKKGRFLDEHPNFAYGVPRRIRVYWRRLMSSTQKKLSRGASNIFRMISLARRDNWRRPKK